MARDCGAHGVGLALQALVVDAGAAADPILRLRRHRAHDRSPRRQSYCRCPSRRARAGRARRRAPPCRRPSSPRRLFVQRRLLGDVAGRLLQRQFVHFEREIERLADLVDRRAAGLEIRDHRLRNRGRKGGDALRDDAMIAGEDRDQGPIDMRRADPCQAAIHSEISSSRPSEPAGLVSCPSRSRAAARAASSAFGILRMRSRMSSKGRVAAFIDGARSFERKGLL